MRCKLLGTAAAVSALALAAAGTALADLGGNTASNSIGSVQVGSASVAPTASASVPSAPDDDIPPALGRPLLQPVHVRPIYRDLPKHDRLRNDEVRRYRRFPRSKRSDILLSQGDSP